MPSEEVLERLQDALDAATMLQAALEADALDALHVEAAGSSLRSLCRELGIHVDSEGLVVR